MDPETETETYVALDKSKVRVGDTVTVSIAARNGTPEFQITGPVYGDGDMDVAVGDYMLMHDRVTLLAHTPVPEPEWKPGAIAVATVNGTAGVRVMRTDGGLNRVPEWFTPEDISYTEDGDDRWYHSDDVVTDVRPLVVIDPAEVYVDALVAAAHTDPILYGDTTPDQMRAAAIRMLAVLGIEVVR